jgi:hypothetical protein
VAVSRAAGREHPQQGPHLTTTEHRRRHLDAVDEHKETPNNRNSTTA